MTTNCIIANAYLKKTVTTKTMKHQNHLTLRKLKSKA